MPKFSAGKTTGIREYTGVIRAFEPGLIRVGIEHIAFLLTNQLESNVRAHRRVGDTITIEYVDVRLAKAIILRREAEGAA